MQATRLRHRQILTDSGVYTIYSGRTRYGKHPLRESLKLSRPRILARAFPCSRYQHTSRVVGALASKAILYIWGHCEYAWRLTKRDVVRTTHTHHAGYFPAFSAQLLRIGIAMTIRASRRFYTIFSSVFSVSLRRCTSLHWIATSSAAAGLAI